MKRSRKVANCVFCLAALAVPCLAHQHANPDRSPIASGTRIASKDNESIESRLGKGYDALKQDSYAVAAQEFRAALRISPRLTLRARFPLAVALFELHETVEARREFEKIRREVGDHPNVLYYLGRLDLEERKFPGAIANLGEAAKQSPFPDTAYYLGFAYFQNGNLAEAEKWLKNASNATPQDARVLYQLAQVFRKQGHEGDARQALQKSEEVRQRGNNESQLRTDCMQKLDQGPPDEAHAVCDQMYDPNDAAKLTALGTIYGQHGDLESALKPLQRAAELDPESPQSQYNVALTYFQMNRLQDARAPLARAVERWPDLFQLNALYGAVLAKLGENEPAYAALLHAHRLNPQDRHTEDSLFLTMLGLGRKKESSKEYPDSLRYFREAAKLKPQEPSPHEGMAEIYSLTGRTTLAASEQHQAQQLRKIAGAN